MSTLPHDSALRFSLPVILENLLATTIGLVFFFFVGQISPSSLSTIGLGNQAIGLISSAASVLVTGSSILCARLTGAGKQDDASHIIEQTLLLTVVSSLCTTVLIITFARPIMTLLMPNADHALLQEGTSFFRILMLSLPTMLITNVLCGVLRATGDSRAPMLTSVLINVLLLAFAFLFLRVFHLDVIGAGLTYVVSRLIGMVFVLWVALRSHHKFALRVSRMLHPDRLAFRRILHIGLPTSVESIFVQLGYLVANSMVIGLGVFEAAVYNVANTLYSFAALPQGILAAIAMTLVGQMIGAGESARARQTGWRIWRIGMLVSLALSGLIVLLGMRLTPIYSSDLQVQAAAADALNIVFFMCIPAISLNTLDPQLRTGGDVRYVMTTSIIAVWAIRLPLTYLFCYQMSMGANGVFLANTLSLTFRMIFNMVRFIQGRYLTMKV